MLTHAATGTAQTSTTNSAGILYFGGAPIGPYTLVVEAAGFRKWEGTLTVQAGQTVETFLLPGAVYRWVDIRRFWWNLKQIGENLHLDCERALLRFALLLGLMLIESLALYTLVIIFAKVK